MRLRNILPVIPAVLYGICLISCGSNRQRQLWPEFSGEERKQVLVEYDGRKITIGSFSDQTQAAAGESTIFALLTIPKLRDYLDNHYVRPEIIMKDMRDRGLDKTPAVVNKIRGHKHVLMAIRLFNEQIKDNYTWEREELQAAWEANKKKYQKHTRVDARQIVTATKQEALMYLDQVKAGAKMGDLARKHSRDTFSANRWGKMGSFPLGMGKYPDNLESVLAGMKVGELAGPVKTRSGWHIFKMIERIDGRQLTLDESIPTIKNDLKQKKEDTRLKAFTDSLRQKFPVTVNQAAYEAMAQDADRVATIGQQNIFVRDIREATRKIGDDGIPTGTERKRVFDTVVRQKIMLAEAYARKFDKDPLVVRLLKSRTRNAMMLHFEKTEIEGRIKVTDEEIRTFYKNRGEKALIRYIATKEKELAHQIRDDLMQGGSINEVKAVAKTRIQVRDAAWDRNETTYRAIMEAAFRLSAKNPVSPVIAFRSPDDRAMNYYILTFKERKKLTRKPFTDEARTIRNTLFRLKKEKLRTEQYDMLFKRAHLRWYDDNMKLFIERWREYIEGLKR